MEKKTEIKFKPIRSRDHANSNLIIRDGKILLKDGSDSTKYLKEFQEFRKTPNDTKCLIVSESYYNSLISDLSFYESLQYFA